MRRLVRVVAIVTPTGIGGTFAHTACSGTSSEVDYVTFSDSAATAAAATTGTGTRASASTDLTELKPNPLGKYTSFNKYLKSVHTMIPIKNAA